MTRSSSLENQIVAAIRRIVRAVDLHSRRLVEHHGVTAPQLATLAAAYRLESATISALARAVHLSQPTVSGIVDRLTRQGYVERRRSSSDRRSVVVCVTEAGRRLLTESPSLLQDRFRTHLSALEDWERYWLLSALQRLATMMDAEGIDASPYLETGPMDPVEGAGMQPDALGASEDAAGGSPLPPVLGGVHDAPFEQASDPADPTQPAPEDAPDAADPGLGSWALGRDKPRAR